MATRNLFDGTIPKEGVATHTMPVRFTGSFTAQTNITFSRVGHTALMVIEAVTVPNTGNVSSTVSIQGFRFPPGFRPVFPSLSGIAFRVYNIPLVNGASTQSYIAINRQTDDVTIGSFNTGTGVMTGFAQDIAIPYICE